MALSYRERFEFRTDPHSNNLIDEMRKCVRQGNTINFKVGGDCMNPHLKKGDKITVQQDYGWHTGDIVVYFCNYTHRIMAHRLLGVIHRPSGKKFMVKPDIQDYPNALIESQFVIGKTTNKQIHFGKRLTCFWLFVYFCLKIYCSNLMPHIKKDGHQKN